MWEKLPSVLACLYPFGLTIICYILHDSPLYSLQPAMKRPFHN